MSLLKAFSILNGLELTLYFIRFHLYHRIQTNDLIYLLKCSYCSRNLSTKGNLKSHIVLIHTKSHERLKCPMATCEQSYNTKRNLVVHLRKHHFGGLEKTKGDAKIRKKIKRLLKRGIVFSFIYYIFLYTTRKEIDNPFILQFLIKENDSDESVVDVSDNDGDREPSAKKKKVTRQCPPKKQASAVQSATKPPDSENKPRATRNRSLKQFAQLYAINENNGSEASIASTHIYEDDDDGFDFTSTGTEKPQSEKIMEASVAYQIASDSRSQDSNAIRTAEKSDRIFETNDSTPLTSHKSRPESPNTDMNVKRSEKNLENEIDKRNNQQQQRNQKDNSQQEIKWTLEEDRLLLEQIKSGFDSNSADIAELAHRLPNKTQKNIRIRIDFLIDFILKLSNESSTSYDTLKENRSPPQNNSQSEINDMKNCTVRLEKIRVASNELEVKKMSAQIEKSEYIS